MTDGFRAALFLWLVDPGEPGRPVLGPPVSVGIRLSDWGQDYFREEIPGGQAGPILTGGGPVAARVWPEPVTATSTLTDSLGAYWPLDEPSGSRADSLGATTLADSNTVTQAVGKIGNAAQFTAANNEYLYVVSNAALTIGTSPLTIAAWVYLDSKPAQLYMVSKFDGTVPGAEYLLYYQQVADRFIFLVGNGTTLYAATANSASAPSTGTWYFLIAWYDAAAATVNIQVNNGTVDSASFASGTPVAAGTTFALGAATAASPQYHNGRIDEVGIWKRVLTAAERTQLYHDGAGLTYPFTGVEPVLGPPVSVGIRLSDWGQDYIRYRTGGR